jgi:DNA-directed RNA polymerase subunit delta
MSNKSMTDIAYEYMQNKNGVPFTVLWSEVCTRLAFTQSQADNKIAQFYSAMMLDTRFTALPDNKWDLRKNYKYKDTHFDTSSILIDDDIDLDDDVSDDADDAEEDDDYDGYVDEVEEETF